MEQSNSEGTINKKGPCRPALVTTALFVSLFIVDLVRQEYSAIIGHALLGVFSILLMNVLCHNNMAFVGWALLFTPFVLIILGYLIFLVQEAGRQPAPIPYLPPPVTSAPAPAPEKELDCCPPPPSPYKYYM
jgi:hypothetical protein